PQAQPGGICVSRQVSELIRNKAFIRTRSLGERELKGIGTPIELFSVECDTKGAEFGELRAGFPTIEPKSAGGRFRPWIWIAAALAIAGLGFGAFAALRGSGLPATDRRLAIAVLPFDNFSHDAARDYIVDGLTEELTATLSQVESLRVISRTSVMEYKGRPGNLPEIAKRLGVDLVIEGSVLASGDQVKITAQLIRMNPERHIMAHTWEANGSDLFKLQRDVSRAIVERLQVSLSATMKDRLRSRHAVKPEAYDAYLQGEKAFAPMTLEAANKALELYQKATILDPGFAPAFAASASCYIQKAMYGELAPTEAWPKVQEYAAKALSLDASDPRSNYAMGMCDFLFNFDFAKAEAEFRKAALSTDASGLMWLSFLLTTEGKHDAAVEAIMEARAKAPGDVMMQINVASRLNHAGRAAEAVVEARKAIAMDSTNYMGSLIEALALAGTGDYDASIKGFRAIYEPSGGVAQEAHAYLVWLLAKTGKRAEAERMLSQMKAATKTTYVSPFLFAIAYMGLERPDDAMDSLRQALVERDINLIWELRDRALAPLHTREDWKALLGKLKLEP
ncbi:MAG: hypothetical protein WCQ50_17630, partial [Spirochaetota bacterium]